MLTHYKKGLNDGPQTFCLKKGDDDRTAAPKKMAQELDDFYEDGESFVCDCSLDKFMVDYNIQGFSEKSLGINSWDDLR